MQSLSLLVKPSTHRCNIGCDYCFYRRVESVYPQGPLMDIRTAERMIASALDAATSSVSFTWQGGEPTLMGLDFFQEVVRLQNRHRHQNQVVENVLQTNGILITEEWARFLKRNRFLVGVSLDGPEQIHDRYRKDRGGAGTYQDVMRGIERLDAQAVPVNILCLLTDINVELPDQLWRFFVDRRFTHLQFIPCRESDPETGTPLPYSISADALLSFYTRLFDLWYDEGFFTVSVRMFEDILIYLLDGVKVSCGWLPRCDSYLVVEHNGDVYPCDFYVYPDRRLGNLIEEPLKTISENPLRRRFADAKLLLPDDCSQCAHLAFCCGDCPRFRDEPGRMPGAPSVFCPVTKGLFAHITPRLSEIRERVAGFRERTQTSMGTVPAAGRNDPCPCGSGLKYKKCCERG